MRKEIIQSFKKALNFQCGWDSRDPNFNNDVEFLETKKGEYFFIDLRSKEISIKK